MSEHNSIQFDPTALLIIKNEIDNSIKLVEGAVSTLIEEQALPFGIDDALEQFKQCTQVLRLIDIEPYRVCRRVNILRDYPDDKTKLYPRN
ncbi:hypothetical protein ACINWCA92_1162 [Acinetobacter baumannii WC-A-92]|nr:hypothetical protein ACINWCA92_1162 [Acinetobacter baumannii WC-A-92]